MKKTLSILLIVTMLLSMCVVALPTFAATETVDNSKTPGHADYDHVTVEEFATALGIETSAVNVITNYEQYCAITSGAADAINYYLVDLSADADGVLELTGKAHLGSKYLSYVYIDFNGYTLDVSGENNAAFCALENGATVKNLKLKGTLYSISDGVSWGDSTGYYKDRRYNVCYSPLTTGKGDGKPNGELHIDNILSVVEFIIYQQHGGGKHFGGLVGDAADNSTITNCVFNGSIIVDNDDDAIGVGSIIQAQSGPLGGIVGVAYDTVTIENCEAYGTITIDEDTFYSTDGNGAGIGGIIGLGDNKESGSDVLTVKNCTNNATITVETWAHKTAATTAAHTSGAVGGILGRVKVDEKTLIENCVNNATISFTDGANHMGGIAGLIDGGGETIYSNCVNNGTLKFVLYNGYCPRGLGIGGISGYTGKWGDTSPIRFYSCVNNGDFDLISQAGTKEVVIGGIMGRAASGDIIFDACVNNGDVLDQIQTSKEFSGTGGMLGSNQSGKSGSQTVFNNCLNTGSLKGRAVGGMFGIMDHDQSGTYYTKAYKCVNIGTLNSAWHAGGMMGFALQKAKYDVQYCINLGDIIAVDCAAGMVGWARNSSVSDVSYSINAGEINGSTNNQFINTNTTSTVTECKTLTKEDARKYASENGYIAFDLDVLDSEVKSSVSYLDKSHKYVALTWDAFTTAYDKALKLLDTDVVSVTVSGTTYTTSFMTYKTVSDAIVALNTTREGLVLTTEMPKALASAITSAEELLNSDAVYTDASWANFLVALNAAKKYQAEHDMSEADPSEVLNVIELLTNAKNALVKGADIYTGADFAKLNGQDGVFNLMADITITEGVDSFAGKLNANGHTITVDGCALFGELNGATIENLVIEGTATKALFGKAVGEVAVKYVYVDVEGDFEKAVLFDAADSAAEIEVKAAYVAATSAATAAILAGNCDIELDTVIADVKAPKLTTASGAECDYAYLVGVEAFIDEAAVELADGAVAYAFTKAFVDTNALAAVKVDFASVTLVQILGVDAFPAVAPFAVDGINVVAPVDASDLSKGYKNAAFRYEDATPVIPVEPIAPVAPIATGLQSSIARAEALVQANYTADTWTALQTALTAAKAALTADTQAAIDSARLALDLALVGLKKAPAAAVTPVNVDALNAAIAAAEALKAGEYTTATWSAVQAALSAAKSAKALGDQAKVDAATAALNAAVAALAKASAPEAPSITKPETTPATEEGCGSVIGGAAVVLTAVIALGAGVSFKKKED